MKYRKKIIGYVNGYILKEVLTSIVTDWNESDYDDIVSEVTEDGHVSLNIDLSFSKDISEPNLIEEYRKQFLPKKFGELTADIYEDKERTYELKNRHDKVKLNITKVSKYKPDFDFEDFDFDEED